MDFPRNLPGRFSLLLLEDGEVLISDIACHYRLVPQCDDIGERATSLVNRLATETRVGRVKVATRSIFFDSDDWRDPVVKIPITSISCMSIARRSKCSLRIQNNGFASTLFATAPPTSSQTKKTRCLSVATPPWRDMGQGGDDIFANSSSSSRADSVAVDSTLIIFQREGGVDHPYVEARFDGRHVFTPLYTEGGMLEAELQSLRNINAIGSRRARESALRELVRERETQIPFDITLLHHGLAERTEIDFSASAVYALSRAPGRVRVTSTNLYFMPIHGDANHAVDRIPLHSLVSARRLRHGCKNAALEVEYNSAAMNQGSRQSTPNPLNTLMLTFASSEAREQTFAAIAYFSEKKLDIYGRNELDLALAKWRRGELSNYEYLMYLNFAAGRSFNDLSQYPVFPWILSDYTSKELDLENPEVFRDLSRPIGALDETRLDALKERYKEMPPPRFFYGTHYSTPAYLINYLVRAAPGAMLRLQNGRFDMPDRLFHSISETWKGVCTNPADVKELIPEFYALNYSKSASSGIVSSTASAGQFLDNVLGLDLGIRQDGKRVDSVVLPPWANGSSSRFVRKLRKALECRLVSDKLHLWIDLIFGVASRSEESSNIFYTDVALPNSINATDMEALTDDDVNQMETIYLEFGRTPEQLFAQPHPPRFGALPSDVAVPDLGVAFDSFPSEGIVTINSISEEATTVLQRSRVPGPSQRDLPVGLTEAISGGEAKGRKRSEVKSLPRSWEAASRMNSGGSLIGRLQHMGRNFSSYRQRSQDTDAIMSDGGTLGACSLRAFQIAKHHPTAEIVNSVSVNLEACSDGTSPCSSKSCESPGSMHGTSGNRDSRHALCTLSDDCYLRVQLGADMIRSRVLEGSSVISAMDNGLVAYGTRNGSIGYYHINSGRTETLVTAAHETRIECLCFVPSLSLLVSGSRDASVKVWQFQHLRRGRGALLLALELDAESGVMELAATRDAASAVGTAAEEDLEWAVRQLLVGILTADGAMLVWRPRSYCAGDAFPDPIWRAQTGASSSSILKQRICWLPYSASNTQAIACISSCGTVVRVWAPAHAQGPRAELVVACPGASCITARDGKGALLVGNLVGEMTEFDVTGRCIGKRKIMTGPLYSMLFQCDHAGLVVCGERDAVHITF